jgi:hypothetical protein
MAFRAMGKVGLGRDTEIIQNVALANALLVVRIQKLPGPVLGFLELLGRLGMTFDTGSRDLGTGLEILLQFLELVMISCRYGTCCSNKNSKDKNDL